MRGKRTLDCVAAGVALAGFAPVLAVAAVGIKLEDGGPVLFKQTRVGRSRQDFKVWKLRTMHQGQVTQMGRWLRATGIDEIPQFVQVLTGQMSVVGPRPLLASDLQRLGWLDDARRFTVKPGITGMSQVHGALRERALQLDGDYAQQASLALDVKLIGLSFAVNVLGKERVRGWLREE